MALSQFRAGLEIEMHGIRLSFKQQGTNIFWPSPQGGVDLNSTMMGTETVLEPLDGGSGFFKPHPAPPRTTNWESNWGFRAVGDAFAKMDITPGGNAANTVNVVYCVMELATAACPVDDYEYWRAARKCSQVFKNAIAHFGGTTVAAGPTQIQDNGFRWIPLTEFITYYNNQVQALALGGAFVPNRFKFARSQPVLDLEAGTHARYPGAHWEAYVSFHPAKYYGSVQVNYQIGLRALCNRVQVWSAAWSSMWATRTQAGPLDPDIGDSRVLPIKDLYASQTYAAVWRKAQVQVEDWWAGRNWTVASPEPAGAALLRALLVYLTVAFTISVPDDDFSKNQFPQLFKTSPASVAEAIVQLEPTLGAYFQGIALPRENNQEMNFVKDMTSREMRNLKRLEGHPGYLPPTPPYYPPPPAPVNPLLNTGFVPFSANSGDLLRDPPSAFFKYAWNTTFDRAANPLSVANKFGYLDGCPFHVPWAKGVNSPFRAVAVPAAIGQPPDVKVLFESRFDRSLLNIGFDPYVDDAIFNRSYLSLVRVVLGEAARDLRAPQVGVDFPDPDLGRKVQNFPNDYRH